MTRPRDGGTPGGTPAPAGRWRGPLVVLAVLAIAGLLVVAVGLRPGGDVAASPGRGGRLPDR